MNFKYLITQSTITKDFHTKVIPIPNGVNTKVCIAPFSKAEAREILVLPPEKKLILFMGKICKRKGVSVFISSVEQAIKICSNAIFLLVRRETEEVKGLKSNIKDTDFSNHILFCGYVSNR
jgi:teichuronic acid biosynthesis glycosyltransferase TuaC